MVAVSANIIYMLILNTYSYFIVLRCHSHAYATKSGLWRDDLVELGSVRLQNTF